MFNIYFILFYFLCVFFKMNKVPVNGKNKWPDKIDWP